MDPQKLTLNFVSESSINEAKKNRVDTGASEQPYDPRTLYERLAEQRQIKEEAFAEAFKLGNMIHRIDDDESEFLNDLIKTEKRKRDEIESEEREALKFFKKEVAKKTHVESPHTTILSENPLPLPTDGSNSLNTRIENEIASRRRQHKKTDLKSLIKISASKVSDSTRKEPPAKVISTDKSSSLPEVPVLAEKPLKLNLVDYGPDSESE